MADPTVTDPSEVNDREGLVYPPPQPAKFNVFGLPFFQSTYVALHNVPQPGSPYVRVAPQWAHERARFCLPAWATAA
ncbi:hypothetical protein BV20DRAFT_1056365 [Pilatotrama ljubarskyi]|nr:hypothetical protein BV20DRAFT_1056365 [Pilatotrama ljubarskyi]